jgi:hypothetical protein
LAGPAACGEEDESPFTETGVTKPRYVSDGDQICRDAERRLRVVGREVAQDARGGDPAADDVARAAEESVVPIVRDRIADLRALEPPPGDEEEVDRIYDAADEALARIEEDPQLAERADEVFREASRLASEYGFQDCAGV